MEQTSLKENKMVELPSLKEWGDSSWRTKAACHGSDTKEFFPERVGQDASSIVSKCKLVCYSCTVRTDCLTFAISNHVNHGVWGGLSAGERRRVSLEDIPRVTRVSVETVIKHLSRRKVSNKVIALSRIAAVSIEEAEKMIRDPKNYYL